MLQHSITDFKSLIRVLVSSSARIPLDDVSRKGNTLGQFLEVLMIMASYDDE